MSNIDASNSGSININNNYSYQDKNKEEKFVKLPKKNYRLILKDEEVINE
jgi:hypothetical protein